MAIELASAGVSVQWAVETTAGTRPTAGYQRITGVKSTPNLAPEPSSYDVTDLSDMEWKRSIPGLRDPGGVLSLLANNTEEFHVIWQGIVDAYDTAKASGLGMWFAIVIPGLTKAFYMSVIPQTLPLNAIEVDSVLQINAQFAPKRIDGWQTKPTEG